MKLTTGTHNKPRCIFQGALVCSLCLHGLVFLALTVWNESLTATPPPQTFKIQKVRLLTTSRTTPSNPEAGHKGSPKPPHAAPVQETVTPPKESLKKEFVLPQPPQKLSKEIPMQTVTPHAAPEPLTEPMTPSARLHETQQVKPVPQPKLHSQKTFAMARVSPHPVTVRTQTPVLSEPMPKIEALPEPEPLPQTPAHSFPMQAGKSALLQASKWETPARNRHAENIQKTRSIGRPLQMASAQRTQTLIQDTLPLQKSVDEDSSFAAPTASWNAPEQEVTDTPEVPISKSVSTSHIPPHENGGSINSENKESVSPQFASKGITGSRSGGEDVDALKNGFILEIRNRIAKYKFYPRLAMRRGLEGQPVVHFRITRNGSIQDLRVALTSGSGILDQAALESVKNGIPFPVIPEALQRDSMTIQLPIAFTLE